MAAAKGMFEEATRESSSGPTIWGSEGTTTIAVEGKVEEGVTMATGRPIEHRFSPYEMNGGTALGIAGDDFCVLAADTRLSQGYSILSRNVSKANVLNDSCIVATGGCYTDVLTLHKTMTLRSEMYEHEHDRPITCMSFAQMLSNTLYGRRFFPYYAFNVVGGLDKEGKGAVYTYDAIGSYERVKYAAQGAGQKLIIPLLDNLVGNKNRLDEPRNLSVDETVEMMKDVFVTAAERDIYTGDCVEIYIMTKDGLRVEKFDLKKD